MAGPSEDLPNDISFDDAQDHYRNGGGVTITLDMNGYMTEGTGRFVGINGFTDRFEQDLGHTAPGTTRSYDVRDQKYINDFYAQFGQNSHPGKVWGDQRFGYKGEVTFHGSDVYATDGTIRPFDDKFGWGIDESDSVAEKIVKGLMYPFMGAGGTTYQIEFRGNREGRDVSGVYIDDGEEWTQVEITNTRLGEGGWSAAGAKGNLDGSWTIFAENSQTGHTSRSTFVRDVNGDIVPVNTIENGFVYGDEIGAAYELSGLDQIAHENFVRSGGQVQTVDGSSTSHSFGDGDSSNDNDWRGGSSDTYGSGGGATSTVGSGSGGDGTSENHSVGPSFNRRASLGPAKPTECDRGDTEIGRYQIVTKKPFVMRKVFAEPCKAICAAKCGKAPFPISFAGQFLLQNAVCPFSNWLRC